MVFIDFVTLCLQDFLKSHAFKGGKPQQKYPGEVNRTQRSGDEEQSTSKKKGKDKCKKGSVFLLEH